MPASTPTICAACGSNATLYCAGCLNPPAYLPGHTISATYCTRACQKRHWPVHKHVCRMMAQRIKLHRAAHILKTALLTYRATLYDIALTKIDLRDGTLYLHQEARDPGTRCTAAMALLSGLIRGLLADMDTRIEFIDLQIEKKPRPTRLVPGPDPTGCPHTVLVVTMRLSGEKWVLDPTGGQYGYREGLVPFARYLDEREARPWGSPVPYDATETSDLDFLVGLPRLGARRRDLEVERRARVHFAGFVRYSVGKEMLAGTAEEFEKRLEGFNMRLKAHLLEFRV
ncbi:hypothetical protein ASPACDRAFT_45014 [Aspergillus aculeatus ATCC 16872]|uniref:MYND-type domain-containing protein n=1 Tax=Aspergillus aculeatus (strain ATCC 16872 / CBS 172.66 / WB 5094) TaxID=690307 RepID=A0A1L9WQP5_ASPA1|nr:uncharacterized protein ASPACDRAFT_45014 [Aspergillus aculeatus ATCC 16872]OJJ98501.1 hypothetical protein ASPACDRAFT_45014 [Aspergillus aculeatus ATCC 16872]